MQTIHLPYCTTYMDLHVDDKNLKAIMRPRINMSSQSESELDIVRHALEHPIGSKRLSKLACGKNRVTLVTSDHTRAVPSKLTLPVILNEIRSGNPKANITILIATGLHRATTKEEQLRMFGKEIVDNECIVVHDAYNVDDMRNICTLPSGAELAVHYLAVECDLLVTEGFIEPHFFAGFSGGRKSILPGISSKETINENHSYKAIAHPNSSSGIMDGNLINEDMIYAANKVGVDFTINVALNVNKKIIAAFAGDIQASHQEGCNFVKNLSQIPITVGDVVVTSNGGYPLDQNLYQSPKAIATAEACAGDDGVIIMCCSCCDGIGGSNFEKLMLSGSVDQIDDQLSRIPPKQTIQEQWCAQIFARILKKHKIILVTTYLDHEIVKKANLIPASSPDEALELAFGMKGNTASVVVIPDGVSVYASEQ